ncbi:MAG: CDP-archaeol synthase [Candidatus Staskawiczbacteria bacterium]|jgi:CDP-2,3-bis-(O-geranylgeranyl)-sn-glycerol synthase
MNYFSEIIGTFLLLLPAGAANMAPVFVGHVNFLNYPADGGKSFMGKRIFGDHKTVRGFFFGTIAAIAVVYIEQVFARQISSYSLVDYASVNFVLFGFLLGFGALLGDCVKSFFKRQMNIAPGKSWWVFDQTDWIIGAFVLLSVYRVFNFEIYITGLIIFSLLHPLINLLGYFLGIKKEKF